MKVPFIMPEFYSSKIITHCFQFHNTRGDAGIGYDMIICRELMVKLVLKAYYGYQILGWDDTVIYMKEPGNIIGQPEITKC